MTTTIQIQEDTLVFLKQMRESFALPSYDSLIKVLLQKAMHPSQSLWGKAGKLSMQEVLKDMRDKSDRY
ncbi:hypothetical protein HYX13_04115 [Candidatus Woesearchaeota archaeon]|nr:hypothetical protein [Candidatus Woesearchaeota archaeon]